MAFGAGVASVCCRIELSVKIPEGLRARRARTHPSSARLAD